MAVGTYRILLLEFSSNGIAKVSKFIQVDLEAKKMKSRKEIRDTSRTKDGTNMKISSIMCKVSKERFAGH